MDNRKVQDAMDRDPVFISADSTLQEAARKMNESNCGFLPIGTADQPEGTITDRDIVVRAIAEGKDPTQEKVRDYMTRDLHCCNEQDTVDDATNMMGEHNVTRLAV